jgi:hypothetical protein
MLAAISPSNAYKLMPRWRVDYMGKGGKHLGTVEAADEREAIAEAAKQFNITPARRFKLVVTKIDDRRGGGH